MCNLDNFKWPMVVNIMCDVKEEGPWFQDKCECYI